MRLIDAEKLEKDLREVIHRKHYSERTILTLYMLLDIIRNRNTIKAEPAKHGKWVKSGGDKYPDYICSECNYYNFMETIYCPNCGAKMEGGDEK